MPVTTTATCAMSNQFREGRHGNADRRDSDVRGRFAARVAVAIPAPVAPDLRVSARLIRRRRPADKKEALASNRQGFSLPPNGGEGGRQERVVQGHFVHRPANSDRPWRFARASCALPTIVWKGCGEVRQANSANAAPSTSRPNVASTVATMPWACSPAFSYIFSGLS